MKKPTKEPTEKDNLSYLLNYRPKLLADAVIVANLVMMKTDRRKLERIQSEIRQLLEKHGYQAGEEWDDFIFKIEQGFVSLGKKPEEANFWITPSMTIEFLTKLNKLAQSRELVSRKIEKAFLHYYNLENYINLRMMVLSWRKSSYFASRIKIINDAKDAHINRKYTLSIPVLLPQMEGILSSLSGKSAGKPGRMFEELLLERDSDVYHFLSKSIIYKLGLGSALFGGIPQKYFTPEKYNEWAKKNEGSSDLLLNRHAILHGVQLKYAGQSNSLRHFSYWMSQE